MAKRTSTITELIDDLDGTKADRTIRFAVDGTNYELDLNKKNANAFGKALKPWVDSARTVRSTRTRTAKKAAATRATRTDLADVRAWAKDNGHAVSDRGRIPVNVVEAYDAAH